jgi:hypothetical protein
MISQDRTLIFTGKLLKPLGIIKFTKSTTDWFTVWNDNVIAPYNKEQLNSIIAMRPYIDELFDPKARDGVIGRYDARCFEYRDLITQKRFEAQLSMLR